MLPPKILVAVPLLATTLLVVTSPLALEPPKTLVTVPPSSKTLLVVTLALLPPPKAFIVVPPKRFIYGESTSV